MSELDQTRWRSWSSEEAPARRRFEAWEEALCDSHHRWRLEGGQRDDYRARLEVGQVGDLQLVKCACDPCHGRRDGREIGADPAPFFGLLMVFAGAERVQVGRHDARVGAGQVLLWDSTSPVRFALEGPLEKLTLLVPRERLLRAAPGAPALVGRALDWRRGMGRVVSSHVTALCDEARYILDDRSGCAAETTLHLVAASLAAPAPESAAHAGLRARVVLHIDERLADPTLDPQAIAEHFGISLRFLHQLFAPTDTTVARCILLRRLERCREALALAPHLGITELAFDWGFKDAAHFSRAFKRRYGESPRQYRQRLTT